MNTGFEIYIQSDLDAAERESAIAYINRFISSTCADPRFRYFGKAGGGYTSGLWRGRLGLEVTKSLVFRRIANGARRFAVVRLDSLEVHNDSLLDKHHHAYRDIEPDGPIPQMCVCPRHRASLCVRFKQKPALDLYVRIGNPKG